MISAPRTVARAIALVIVLTGLPALRMAFSFLVDLDLYTNLTGWILIASAINSFVLVGGAIAVIANRTIGYPIVYVTAILSLFGQSWYYIPFLGYLFESPVARLAATVIGNMAVLLFLAFCQREESRQAATHGAV